MGIIVLGGVGVMGVLGRREGFFIVGVILEVFLGFLVGLDVEVEGIRFFCFLFMLFFW